MNIPDQEIGPIGDHNHNNGTSGSIPLDECQCTICTEYFIRAVETDCHHRFCNFCIHRWFRSTGRRQCPTCRRNVTHLNPLPNLDRSIQRMIRSLSGEQILERERIRHHRQRTSSRGRRHHSLSGSRNQRGSNPVVDPSSTNIPVSIRPTPRSTNASSISRPRRIIRRRPISNMLNREFPNPGRSALNRAQGESNSSPNNRYINEMTETMNDYEYHLTQAQAAQRLMIQARNDFEMHEGCLHSLFNRFVDLTAASELHARATTGEINLFNDNGLADSDLEDLTTPLSPSRPSTLGLGINNSLGSQRVNSGRNRSLNPGTRNHLRSPRRMRSLMITPLPDPNLVDASAATPERSETMERVGRRAPRLETQTGDLTSNFSATPLTNRTRRHLLSPLTVRTNPLTIQRRPTINDLLSLRNDITRNANQTRDRYNRQISLRRAVNINNRRLEQLSEQRTRFQSQVDRLEAQTFGSERTFIDRDTTNNRDYLRTATVTRTDQTALSSNNSNRQADDANEGESLNTRVLGAQTQMDDSESEERENTRGNNPEESGSQRDYRDGDSDSELRIEFRTPTMTLKMTNFVQK